MTARTRCSTERPPTKCGCSARWSRLPRPRGVMSGPRMASFPAGQLPGPSPIPHDSSCTAACWALSLYVLAYLGLAWLDMAGSFYQARGTRGISVSWAWAWLFGPRPLSFWDGVRPTLILILTPDRQNPFGYASSRPLWRCAWRKTRASAGDYSNIRTVISPSDCGDVQRRRERHRGAAGRRTEADPAYRTWSVTPSARTGLLSADAFVLPPALPVGDDTGAHMVCRRPRPIDLRRWSARCPTAAVGRSFNGLQLRCRIDSTFHVCPSAEPLWPVGTTCSGTIGVAVRGTTAGPGRRRRRHRRRRQRRSFRSRSVATLPISAS